MASVVSVNGSARISQPVTSHSSASTVIRRASRNFAPRSVWLRSPKAVVPPNLANLPKWTFRIMVSADLDNLGGHPHHPYHHSSTRLLRRHEHADP